MHVNARRALFIILIFAIIGLVLAACAALFPTPEPTETAIPLTATPSATLIPTITLTPTITPRPTFPLPLLTPITPIPPPVENIEIPEGLQVIALLGADAIAPFVGRTDAMVIVIFNPQTGRASAILLPPDLFVYIPGYTMQRLNIAYAVGGFKQFASTIYYNLGIMPTHYAVLHLNDFVNAVDDLTGISVQAGGFVLELCGGNRPGQVEMDGQQAFCYARVRFGADEEDRSRRQIAVYTAMLARLVRGGTLTRLPDLFQAYQHSVVTDLKLEDLTGYLPMLLRLGDPARMEYYFLPNDDLTPWQIPGQQLSPTVLLPDMDELASTVRQAIAFVMKDAPLSPVIKTLESELTITPTPTATATYTRTSTSTPQPYRSPTITRTPTSSITPTETSTRRPTRTPTVTITPTTTLTETLTLTPTETVTPTEAPTP